MVVGFAEVVLVEVPGGLVVVVPPGGLEVVVVEPMLRYEA